MKQISCILFSFCFNKSFIDVLCSKADERHLKRLEKRENNEKKDGQSKDEINTELIGKNKTYSECDYRMIRRRIDISHYELLIKRYLNENNNTKAFEVCEKAINYYSIMLDYPGLNEFAKDKVDYYMTIKNQLNK